MNITGLVASVEPEEGPDFDSLSERERQVISLAAQGKVDKQIGQELGVSHNTLRTYWARIRAKVGELPRPALVAGFIAKEVLSSAPTLPDPLTHDGWIMDPKTRLVTASEFVSKERGLKLGVKHPSTVFERLTHPEDVERVRDQIYAVARGETEHVHLVYRVLTLEGVKLANLSVYGVKDASGEVVKVYGYRIHALDCRPPTKAAVRVGHWEEEDFESEEFEVDKGFAEIFGLPTSGCVHRSKIRYRRHESDAPKVRADVKKAIERGDEYHTSDLRYVLEDGSVIYGRAIRRLHYQDDGSVKILGTFLEFQ